MIVRVFKLISCAAILSYIVFVLSACTQNREVKDDDAKSNKALVGVWRGEGGYASEADAAWTESWRIVREANGKYAVDYLIVNDTEKLYELSSDAGTWSYENGVYYEINSNGNKITYEVYSVKNDWFEYNITEKHGSAHIQETKTVESYQLEKPPKDYSLVTYEQPIQETTKSATE